MRDSRGLIYSTALHGVLLLLLIAGLPHFLKNEIDAAPEVVSVDILPVRDISNVKPQDDAHKEKVQKEETAPKQTVETHVKQEHKEEPVPLPVKPKEHEKVVAKKPPPKPKTKPKADPLKSIFEGVEQAAKKEGPKAQKATVQTSQKQAKSQHYDPGAPLSMSEQDAIKQQVSDKWDFPAGAKNASDLKVSLHIELNPDGSLAKPVEFTGDRGRYNSDSFYRSAVDSAIRAVNRAAPLKNLPAEKYNVRDGWREIDMDFTPPDT